MPDSPTGKENSKRRLIIWGLIGFVALLGTIVYISGKVTARHEQRRTLQKHFDSINLGASKQDVISIMGKSF